MKYISRPTHLTHKIFDKNFAAIYESKPVLIFQKPIYVGFAVLELSKWFKKVFDAELIFSDRDSFTYEIKSENVYKEFF